MIRHPAEERAADTIQYPVDRQRILDVLKQQRLGNTVVITGDVHVNFVRNVPPDHLHLDAEPVATEFIGTSVSTGGDRTLSTVFGADANNPHLQFTDNHHGYVRCIVTPEQWRTDYRVVPSVIDPVDGGSTWKSASVTARSAGITTTLFVLVPARSLPSGDYNLELSGVDANGAAESIENYSFRISRP